MSAAGPPPRPLKDGPHQRPIGIAVVVAWVMTRVANRFGRSQAPERERRTEASPRKVSNVVPIPLTSLGDVSSLEASVSMSASGTLKGKGMSGDLMVQFLGDERQQYLIDITGDLLGPIAAQIGGKVARFFRPKQVSVYVVEDGNYMVASGLTDVCIKTEDTTATDALSLLNPRTLMAILTDSDVARGSLVGTESLDGTTVDHYVIDGPTFLAAARASTHPAVETFGQALRRAADADIYIDSETGYPVRYEGAFSGEHPIGLDGDFSVRIDLTKVGTDSTVVLPKACAKPISR